VPLAVLADAVHRPARRQARAPLRPATRLLPLCAGRWCTRPADIGSRGTADIGMSSAECTRP
jgi:hypothetical protein